MTRLLGPASLTREFGLGLGVGLILWVAFTLLKRVAPWEYQRFREKRAARVDLQEELGSEEEQ